MNEILIGEGKLGDLTKKELIELVKQLLPLIDKVKELEAELERLKNKNSRNSSLPPSRDKQDTKKKTSSLRGKSDRKSGGQKGHTGSNLRLSEQVDQSIDYSVDQCSHCSDDISRVEGVVRERKQVWDIPPVTINVTEHRRRSKCCDQCGKWTSAKFGDELKMGPPVRYGKNLINQVCYHHIRQLIPYKRLVEMIEVLYGHKISEGTVDNMLKSKAEQAASTYEQIIDRIEQSTVLGVDESGCSVEGDKSWIWTWVTRFFSLFYISNNRGKDTSNHLFPSGFINAVLTSDCWSTHLITVAKNHQICIPHLQRECQALMDFHHSKWAKSLFKVLLDIMINCRKARIPKKTKQKIEDTLDTLLSRELKNSHKKVKLLRNRLLRLRQYLTVCLYNRKVPPDNNWSERALRMIKLKLKISGTFRSWNGADRFSILRTIVDSAIKQDIHPFSALDNPNIILNSS